MHSISSPLKKRGKKITVVDEDDSSLKSATESSSVNEVPTRPRPVGRPASSPIKSEKEPPSKKKNIQQDDDEEEEPEMKAVPNKKSNKVKRRGNVASVAVDCVDNDGYPYPHRTPFTYKTMTRQELANMDFSACPLNFNKKLDKRDMYKIDAILDVRRNILTDSKAAPSVSDCLVRWTPSIQEGPLVPPMLKHFKRKMVVDKIFCSKEDIEEGLSTKSYARIIKDRGEVTFKVLPLEGEDELPEDLKEGIRVPYSVAMNTRAQELIEHYTDILWGAGETHQFFDSYVADGGKIFDDSEIKKSGNQKKHGIITKDEHRAHHLKMIAASKARKLRKLEEEKKKKDSELTKKKASDLDKTKNLEQEKIIPVVVNIGDIEMVVENPEVDAEQRIEQMDVEHATKETVMAEKVEQNEEEIQIDDNLEEEAAEDMELEAANQNVVQNNEKII